MEHQDFVDLFKGFKADHGGNMTEVSESEMTNMHTLQQAHQMEVSGHFMVDQE